MRTIPDENSTDTGGDAQAGHQADRPPTEDEERRAEAATEAEGSDEMEKVAAHYEEMAGRGAGLKGEGEID